MHCNGRAMLMRQPLQSSVASHNQKSTPQTRAFPSVFFEVLVFELLVFEVLVFKVLVFEVSRF